MANLQNLNLARKWRPASFETVVGQDLAVKILKNSIYLNQFLPVYLFSGQRGCGKTSTARIFSAAINCKKLSDFQKNPKENLIPCGDCKSCISMKDGKHPDFIEIDAASNTGVENIRGIIESSSFLPILGSKKIYLIDEAHMLSRAAFNAFLKLLEEPPPTVIFILATTEPDKILETVRSRSFQLFFNFVDKKNLSSLLENICKKESISYSYDALEVISKESDGSVRDAVNLLERVRFAGEKVTKDLVYQTLGFPSEDVLIELILKLIKKIEIKDLLIFLQNIDFSNLSASYIFQKLLSLSKDLIYLKNEIDVEVSVKQEDISSISLEEVINFVSYLTSQEDVLLRVNNKNLFLEIVFIDFITKKKILIDSQDKKKSSIKTETILTEVFDKVKTQKNSEPTFSWKDFIDQLNNCEDQLVKSVFSYAHFVDYKKNSNSVSVAVNFDKRFSFLQDMIQDTKKTWLPILKSVFSETAELLTNFENSGLSPKIEKEKKETRKEVVIEKKENFNNKPVKSKNYSYNKKSFKAGRLHELDVSDKNSWSFSNKILESFPGKFYLLDKGDNE